MHKVVHFTSAVLFLLPRPAPAQCTPTHGVDTLEAVNQSRQLVRDFEEMRDLYHWDLEALRGSMPAETVAPSKWYANATLLGSKASNGSLRVCTAGGELGVELERQWVGLVGWVESFDAPVGLRFFLFSQSAKLVEPAEEQEEGRTFASYGQPLLALEVQHTRWLALTFGWIMSEQLELHPDLRESVAPATRSGQPLLAIQVPELRARLSSLIRSGSSEQTWVDIDRYPLPDLPIDVSAEIWQLRAEEQLTAGLGLGWFSPTAVDDRWEQRLGAKAATEHNPLRLRSLQAEASLAARHASKKGRAEVELYASWSLFNSRRFAEKTGRNLVHGADIGFRLGVGYPLLLFIVEGFSGINRPRSLGLFPELVDKGEWGFRGGFRFYVWPIG